MVFVVCSHDFTNARSMSVLRIFFFANADRLNDGKWAFMVKDLVVSRIQAKKKYRALVEVIINELYLMLVDFFVDDRNVVFAHCEFLV